MKLKDIINTDKKRYDFTKSYRSMFSKIILREHEYIVWRYVVLLRKEEYYSGKGRVWLLLSFYYRRKKNVLGERLGITIPKNVFAEGLLIWHYGNIVVNSHAKVGKNCTLHGDNCIGNNGLNNKNPIIGSNVDIGVGAKIIGDIQIADNVIIAAGAIVNKSVLESNVVVAGVPAKIVKYL